MSPLLTWTLVVVFCLPWAYGLYRLIADLDERLHGPSCRCRKTGR